MNLTFPQECTVEFTEEVKTLLLAALSNTAPTVLSFAQVERADLSFFQLLHVAEKSFREAGRELIFTPDLSPSFAFKAAVTQWSRLIRQDPAS